MCYCKNLSEAIITYDEISSSDIFNGVNSTSLYNCRTKVLSLQWTAETIDTTSAQDMVQDQYPELVPIMCNNEVNVPNI